MRRPHLATLAGLVEALRHTALAPRMPVKISVSCVAPAPPVTVSWTPPRHPARVMFGPQQDYAATDDTLSEATLGFFEDVARMLCETRAVDRAEILVSEGALRRPPLSHLHGITIALSIEACCLADTLLEHRYSQVARPAIFSELERQGWAHESGSGERAKEASLRRFFQPSRKSAPSQATTWRWLTTQARSLSALVWR